MAVTVLSWGENDTTQWFYDSSRSRMLHQDPQPVRDARAQREQKAKAAREERKKWEEARRRSKQFDEKRLRERRDSERRTYEIKGRVDMLRKRVAGNADDDAARSELSYARAQLFWARDAL